MEQIRRNVFIGVSIMVIIVSGWGYFGYRGYKREKLQEAREAEKKVLQNELAERYGAILNWNKDMRYTAQLQELLVKSGKPVLFTGVVDDVSVEDGQYYVGFMAGGLYSWYSSEESSGSEAYFLLRCDPDQASEIMGRLKRRIAKGDADLSSWQMGWLWSSDWIYAVVASIDDVSRPILRRSSYSRYESDESEYEYEPSTVFIASGTCIDMVYIGREDDSLPE